MARALGAVVKLPLNERGPSQNLQAAEVVVAGEALIQRQNRGN